MAYQKTCDKSFASNYLLLVPEEARIIDLVLFLFSSHADKRRFIETPRGTKIPLPQRLIIIGACGVQIIFKLFANPLKRLGYAIEQWLNLLHVNGGLFGLIFKILRGRRAEKIQDRNSSKYLSIIGLLDDREKLDENIPFGDSRYNPALAIMAAKLSYENSACNESVVSQIWKMKFLGFYDFWNAYQEKATTQALLFRQNENTESELICVAFRGTSPFDADDWITDLDISYYELPEVGRVHSGFMKALGLQKSQGWPKNVSKSDKEYAYYAIREMLKNTLKTNPKAKFIVTGHSLGGALAILFPAILAYHEEKELLERLDGVYTYGQPRVGDDEFRAFMEANMKSSIHKYFRIVYCNDLVPRIPWDDAWNKFKHFGTCAYFDSLYRGKIVAEVPNKNYISVFKFIPNQLNCLWELIRGFGMGLFLGRDYKESNLMRAVRLLGFLSVVGIPAHYPPDYVNSTRLASPDLYVPAHGFSNEKTRDRWLCSMHSQANDSPV